MVESIIGMQYSFEFIFNRNILSLTYKNIADENETLYNPPDYHSYGNICITEYRYNNNKIMVLAD